MITGAQIRAARELLGWAPSKLAQRAKMPTATLHRAECVKGEPPITTYHTAMIREALEHGGVEFIAGHEPGVKLKTTRRGEAARAGLDSRLSNRT